ncbi:unnamed protein product [Linum trigynum]|uniref:Uncharacterized protein n=1 Tax=Linum trigynum TaxID=586398 RepID=A0AAV2DKY1_9ROSI
MVFYLLQLSPSLSILDPIYSVFFLFKSHKNLPQKSSKSSLPLYLHSSPTIQSHVSLVAPPHPAQSSLLLHDKLNHMSGKDTDLELGTRNSLPLSPPSCSIFLLAMTATSRTTFVRHPWTERSKSLDRCCLSPPPLPLPSSFSLSVCCLDRER